jgi:hypothetical protein
MAIALVGSEQDTNASATVGPASPFTASVAVGDLSAGGGLGIAIVSLVAATATIVPSGMTWNGEAMTQAAVKNDIVATGLYTAIYYKTSPAHNGTYNVVATFSAPVGGAVTGIAIVSAWATGVHATPLDDTSTVGPANGDPVVITVTPSEGGELDICASCSQANALAAIPVIDATALQTWDQGGNCVITSYDIPAGSGDDAHTHDYSQAEDYVGCGATFKAAGGAPPAATPTLMMMGIGP